MKKTLTLDHLESQLPEGILAAAERYVQEGRLDHLRELDKNLWQARITGFEQIIEPEVLLRGNYVKAFSCECSKGSKRIPCAHLTALLLMIRKIRKQKLENQATNTPPVSKTRDLIEILSGASLRKFTREWAAKDPEFELALRAEFFHLYRSGDHEQQLRQLFLTFLQEDGSLCTDTAASLRSVQVLVRHVLRQCEALLENDEDPRAYQNMVFILRHLSLSPGFRNRSTLARQILQLVTRQGVEENMDPSSDRFDFLLGSIPLFLAIDEERLLPPLLLELQAFAGFPLASQKINASVGELLHKARHTIQDPQALLLVYYQTLNPKDKQGPWLEKLGLPRLSPSAYTNLSATLLDTGDFEGAMILSDLGLQHYPQFADLLRIQVKCLWESHHFNRLYESLKRLLVIHLIPEDMQFARTCLDPEIWGRFCHDLGCELKELPSSYSRNVLLAEALYEMEDIPALEELIVRSQSPKLMHRFFGRLYTLSSNRIGETFERFLQQYLTQHLGPPATKTLAGLLELVPKDDRTGLSKRLQQFLRMNFPERMEIEHGLERHKTLLP